ncbi:MAG: RsmE family RNA methyltransferase, partial [Eubacteriales bacterium]
MRRFFTEIIEKPAVTIRGDEAYHMLKVLRMVTGDFFYLIDGSGREYLCRIESIGTDHLVATVGDESDAVREPGVHITLYQAMLKKDNMDLVLQKTTELGIASFVPVLAARCIKRPDDAAKLAEKYGRIAKEAAKQCGRLTMPQIGTLTALKDLKTIIQKHQTVLLAYEHADIPIKTRLQGGCPADIALIIGPEGGFEPKEVQMLIDAGAVECSLGNLILRAETAAIASVAMILYESMG